MPTRHADEDQLARVARARGLDVEQLDSDGLGIGVFLGREASAHLSLDIDDDTVGRVSVTFGWPDASGAYAVAQMGVFPDLATAWNFTIWANKAEGTRISRGGQPDDRFGVSDRAYLVEPAN